MLDEAGSISPSRNIVIWNSLLSMYTRCGAPSKALRLWQEHHEGKLPDKFTLTCVLAACVAVGGREGIIREKVEEKNT
jgi:pentatricopeptide repeat protein